MIKQFYFKQFNLAYHLFALSLNGQTVLFDSFQVFLLQVTVDLRAMAMKGYAAFLKALALLEPHHHIV